MYIQRQSIFLQTLSRNPCRIAFAVFFIMLNFISGITTNVYFFSSSASEFTYRSAAATPLSLECVLGAALWQLMLCCAARWGRRGGTRMAVAFAAVSLESFVAGFSLSELLFHYGTEGMLPALLLNAFCGATGIMLRLYILLPLNESRGLEGRRTRDAFLTAQPLKVLFALILLQGIVLPMLLCS